MPKPNLRPCAISGHQLYCKGFLFHGFFLMSDGTWAFVEDDSGHIQKYNMSLYQLQFLDREEKDAKANT